MKLFSGKIGIIAAELVKVLVEQDAIETEEPSEVELDIEAVLKEYVRTDRHLTEKSKDICEEKGLPFSAFPKIKKQLADRRGFATGDDALDYLMEQLIGAFMQSRFVEEIFLEDHELKLAMRTVLRKHTEIEDELDKEARAQLKNLQEGTQDWEIEYSKTMAQIKRKRGL